MTRPENEPTPRMATDATSDEECAEFLDQIVYLIDNELDEVDSTQVQRHLKMCAPCLERYDLQRTVKMVVARSCCEVAPEGLRSRVLTSIRAVQVQIREG